jgi:hypothetical protein
MSTPGLQIATSGTAPIVLFFTLADSNNSRIATAFVKQYKG